MIAPLDRPVQPEPRHHGVSVAVEVRVEATHGEHELAGVRSLEPDDVCEAAGQPDVAVEQVRVVRQLALHPQDAFRGGEPHEQRELDRHQRDLRPRQREPGQTEQRDVEAVADLDRDDGDAVDDDEAGERQPGREPERAALHREERAEAAQLLHRVARRGRRVQRLDQRVVAEGREVRRHHERAVDAEAAADPGEEERRRTTDRTDDRRPPRRTRRTCPGCPSPRRSRRRW